MKITFQTCKGNISPFTMNLHNKHNSFAKEWSVETQGFYFIHLIIIFSGYWALLHMKAVEYSKAKWPLKKHICQDQWQKQTPTCTESWGTPPLSHYSVEMLW